MTSRELICDTLARRRTSRIPITDLCFWQETLARWRNEGFPDDADVYEFFGLDRVFLFDTDDSPRFEETVVDEDDEALVVSNSYGCYVKKWKHSCATPTTIKHPIDDLSQAEAYMSSYNALPEVELDPAQVELYRKSVERGDFMAVTPLEPAWFVIEYLLGFESGLMALMERPDETSAIMKQLADYSLSNIKSLMNKGIKFDALWFFSDLCFKNGMLFSPKVYRDIVQPIHRMYRRFCDENDMFFMLHCDGDVRNFIPLAIESGFDAVQPLEARAGNDVRELKELYGDKITFYGNINADVIANGTREQIWQEVTSKINTAKQGGGYIYHIDHSVPPTVSFDNYCELMKALKEVMSVSG